MRLAPKIFFASLIAYVIVVYILAYQSINLPGLEHPKKLLFVNSEDSIEPNFTHETFNLKGKDGFLTPESNILEEKIQPPPTPESQHPSKSIYEIFQALGAYPGIKPPYVHPNYNKSKFKLLHEDDYCRRADQYNFEHSENMLQNNIFYTDFPLNTFVVGIARKYGKVVSNQVKTNGEYVHVSSGFDVSITGFFVSVGVFHNNYKIGEQFLCATQMHNQIPGHYSLVSKNNVINSVHQYMEKYADKPQCFNKSSLFPMAYRLHEKEECQNFFAIINSEEYRAKSVNEPIQYLIKVTGMHQGSGVVVLTKDKEKVLNKNYDYGQACEKKTAVKIAQKISQILSS